MYLELNAMWYFLVVVLPNIILAAAGTCMAGWIIFNSFLSSQKGTLVPKPSDMPRLPLHEICDCRQGSSALAVHVRLEDGRTVEAGVSPCMACLEGLREGDTVSILSIQGKLIVQRGSRWGM